MSAENLSNEDYSDDEFIPNNNDDDKEQIKKAMEWEKNRADKFQQRQMHREKEEQSKLKF